MKYYYEKFYFWFLLTINYKKEPFPYLRIIRFLFRFTLRVD